jgi:membrane protease YdiL (CAAX protease family)
MNIKIISAYLAVLILSFSLHLLKPANSLYYSSLPLLMLMLPVIFGHRVKIRFSIKGTAMGLIVSAIILLPYYLFFGESLSNISIYFVTFQLLGIAFPEEFFFRGFIQDSIGRNLKAVLLVSLLFSLAHLPKAIFLNEWMSLLSFFPSLAMGWLYMKTNNILPGTIFHLLANIAYQN